jgi:hypothetical protein
MKSLTTSLSCGLGLLLILSACRVATDQTSDERCVDIQPTNYDQSCKADSDCVAITSGQACTGYDCACANAAINKDDLQSYEQLHSTVQPGPGPLCECPALGFAHCAESKCTFSLFEQPDAGPDSAKDGGKCVDIEPSSYDQSCTADSDCVGISSGQICTGYDCTCPNAAINKDDQASYEKVFSSVQPGPGPICECPALGLARCVKSKCDFVTGTIITHP